MSRGRFFGCLGKKKRPRVGMLIFSVFAASLSLIWTQQGILGPPMLTTHSQLWSRLKMVLSTSYHLNHRHQSHTQKFSCHLMWIKSVLVSSLEICGISRICQSVLLILSQSLNLTHLLICGILFKVLQTCGLHLHLFSLLPPSALIFWPTWDIFLPLTAALANKTNLCFHNSHQTSHTAPYPSHLSATVEFQFLLQWKVLKTETASCIKVICGVICWLHARELPVKSLFQMIPGGKWKRNFADLLHL